MRSTLLWLSGTAILLFASAGRVSATPNVDGVSGTLSGGQTVTVSGSRFGAKVPAAPIIWETFDDGVSGQSLSTDANWPAYGTSGGKFSSISPHSGGLCVANYVAHSDPNDDGFATNNFFFAAADQIYYSYVYRHEGTDVGPGVQKNGRINTAGSLYSGPGVLALSDSYVYYRPDDVYVYPEDDDGTGRYFSSSVLGGDTWTRHQLYGRLSDPAGTANGLLEVSVGDEEKTFANIITRSAGYSFQYNSVILGLMFANIDAVPGARHDMYVDDVYIDNTRARVELCTGSSWGLRGECNPQPPTSWTDSSIEATVNTGQWAVGQTVYLYVVDSSGETNTIGFEVEVDAKSGGTVPLADTGVVQPADGGAPPFPADQGVLPDASAPRPDSSASTVNRGDASDSTCAVGGDPSSFALTLLFAAALFLRRRRRGARPGRAGSTASSPASASSDSAEG